MARPSSSRTPLASFAAVLSLVPAAYSYSWKFERNPQQCGNLTINIEEDGAPGRPPYRILIIPSGPSPVKDNKEVRTIQDRAFPGNSNTLSFQLNYPEGSQFIAVVSDASGFGSGGTSVAAQVTSSNDASCFDATQDVRPAFYFSIEPSNQYVQCKETRLWWDPALVRGRPTFLGVIPGGESFSIPSGDLTTVPNQGVGFNYKIPIRGGTNFIIVCGDDRGNGTGGSLAQTVSAGVENDSSCLSDSSPSSTPGSPAGGSYPTSKDGGTTTGGGSSTNIGAIVGGVIGGVALIILAALVFWALRRRSRKQKKLKEKPVDLLNADEGDERHGAGRTNELPQYYQPEPFLVPDPTIRSSDEDRTADEDLESRRPLSGATGTMSFYTRTGTPDPSMASHSQSGAPVRKGGAPRPLRPVNIIQHDDAGVVPGEDADEPETVELPPAYTALGRKKTQKANAANAAASGSGAVTSTGTGAAPTV